MKLYQPLSLNDIKGNKPLLQVWKVACKAHNGQKRRGVTSKGESLDYITHPYRTMEILANALGNPKVEIQKKENLTLFAVALLHDTMEDTYLNSAERLAAELKNHTQLPNPERIASYVQELSNPPKEFIGKTEEEKAQAKEEWQKNHVQTISITAKMVKMADQISNSVDCAELSIPLNKTGEQEKKQALDKKSAYIKKAMNVCVSCLIGTEKASIHAKKTFKNLLEFEKQVYFYTTLRVEKPNYFNQSFFTQSIPLPTTIEKKADKKLKKPLTRKYIRLKKEGKNIEREL